jgi:anti-sigma factor RsiW
MTSQTRASGLTCHDVRERVEFYLDRTLPQAESEAVRRHLLACASCRAEAGEVGAVETRLRNAFRDEEPPDQLWPRIAMDLRAKESGSRNAERRPSFWRLSRRGAIAASALLAVGFVLAERQRRTTTGIDASELMQTPLDELRSFLDSGRSVDVTATNPVQLRDWFVSKVDFPPPTPPTMSGLSLVGGRLCYFFQRRIAAYMYHIDGHVLSLYIMSDRGVELPSNSHAMLGGRPAAVRELDGFAHILWLDGTLCYSVVSNQSAAQLFQVAQAVATTSG